MPWCVGGARYGISAVDGERRSILTVLPDVNASFLYKKLQKMPKIVKIIAKESIFKRRPKFKGRNAVRSQKGVKIKRW